MKGHPPSPPPDKRHLILKLLFTATISYLGYIQITAKKERIGGFLSQSSPYELSVDVDLGVHGGLCPNTFCPIGTTSIREAFRQAPEAVDVVRSNPLNRLITVPVDDDGITSFKMMI
jgi:hypothetical protein